MIKIAPSILASDFSRLGEEIGNVERAGADMLHFDIMDGHFVPNISFGPALVKSIRKCSKLKFDVHLMIENPDAYIENFSDAGADIITVHAEACRHLNRTINHIKGLSIQAGVSLNPATPLSFLEWVLEDVDMVLLMTVNPGFGGQSYIESSTEKIRDLKKMCNEKKVSPDIEVDGGIDLSNIYKVTEAGANVIVAGTTIFKAPDRAKIISELKSGAYKNTGSCG